MEDMGWNLKGQPWLVHSFKTYATNGSGAYDGESQDYGMNVPHLLYKNINTSTGVNNTEGVAADLLKHGQFISGRSWVEGTTLELGSAFFTQTAIMDDTEELTFKMPVYTTLPSPAPAMVSIARKPESSSTEDGETSVAYDDVVEICPEQDAEATISYQPGADGLKWYALNESLAHIYVPSTTGLKLSLVSKAPIEVEIPLGVTIPEAGEYTIALPSPQAYGNFEAVWLIDHQTGTQTNLLEQSYVLNATGVGDVTARFSLKFGGKKPGAVNLPSPTTIKLKALRGRLPLSNLSPEKVVHVHNVNGQLIFNGLVSELKEINLPDGVYIVRIY